MFPVVQPSSLYFTPANLGSSLLSWWDGQDPAANGIPPASGTAIATWVDKRGINNLTQATGANQPIYTSNLINGRAALLFTNKLISKTISSLAGNKAVTCFGVATMLVESSACCALGSTASSGLLIGFIRRQVSVYAGFVWSGFGVVTSFASDANPHSFLTAYNPTGSDLSGYVDNISSTRNGSAVASNTSGNFIAGAVNGVGQMTGYIGEIGLMNTVATPDQILNISTYLKNRWGTP
jgi:hypothetical protein